MEKHLIKCSLCPEECERANFIQKATCFECKKKNVKARNVKYFASISKEDLRKYKRASYRKMKRLSTLLKKKSIV